MRLEVRGCRRAQVLEHRRRVDRAIGGESLADAVEPAQIGELVAPAGHHLRFTRQQVLGAVRELDGHQFTARHVLVAQRVGRFEDRVDVGALLGGETVNEPGPVGGSESFPIQVLLVSRRQGGLGHRLADTDELFGREVVDLLPLERLFDRVDDQV